MAFETKAVYSAISLFTGAGGLDLGLEAAGFDVRAALEMDQDCVATLRKNRDWPVIDRSIHEVSSEELLRLAGLGVGEVDLLVGGPPCQPFSKSGYWASGDTKRLDDPRATTLEGFLRILRDTRPKAFLLENVAGLAYSGKDEAIQFITRTIEHINKECGTRYRPELMLLNAVDFGAPQIRERAFLVGARTGMAFGRMKPSHYPPAIQGMPQQMSFTPSQQVYRTAWDAIGDLQEENNDALGVTGKWADLLPAIPEGSNYLYHTERGDGVALFGWRRRFWNFLLKLAKDLPSWTITASPGPATGPFHWSNRRLSVRELCRIQTFPEGYRIVGSYRSALRQVGNAVPCVLAEAIGIEIRARLLGDLSAKVLTPTMAPSRRIPVPPPEPVAAVPSKYLNLIGSHTPHPGTGKGHRARANRLKAEAG